MSYAIVRVQKFKASAVRGIQFHNRREKDSRTNPDIDKSRTPQNVTLIDCPDYRAAIADRLSTLKTSRAVRKDAVVMAQVLVTSGPEFFRDMPQEKQQAFFRQSLDFIANRYGKENILSAVIHMDEKTPHMHVDLTPIRDGRLTAKAIFTRAELGNLQTDFARDVGQQYGLKRGESREEKQRHLSTAEYKLKARRDELEKNAADLQPAPLLKADDVVPQKVGLLKKEEPAAVAARLNDKLAPLRDAMAQVRLLQSRVGKLEAEQERQRPELDRLKQYRKIFREGLTNEQQRALWDAANAYRAQNKEKEEKERQEALEREKRERERKARREEAGATFDRYLRGVPGLSLAQRKERHKEAMSEWDQQPPEIQDAILAKTQQRIEQQEQARQQERSRSRGPSMGMGR